MWVNVERADGLFFVRTPSVRTLLNHYREMGARNVAIKVASRRKERARNEKWLSFGIGRIAEAGPDCPWAVGTQVVFVAPSHARCMERVVLPFGLMSKTPTHIAVPNGRLLHVPAMMDVPDAVRALVGWSAHSGDPIDDVALFSTMEDLAKCCGALEEDAGRRLRTGSRVAEHTATTATRPATATTSAGPTATLFGYGNYAKSVILPSIEPWLKVTRVHECDPTQIGPRPTSSRVWDTAPALRAGSTPDVVIVAGYHHTHADIAVAALERGAQVLLEKPLATTHDQRRRLGAALDESDGDLFACFQKRYSPFNELLRDDLGVGRTTPLDYHCVVYEEPLPPRHWYRWPVSRGRLISNGCHWIDHFLFLNGFAAVTHAEARRSGSGALSVALELDTGATFTMSLSDRGSSRIGLQDYIEIRSDDGKVTIQNSTRYVSERRDRIVRRATAKRLDAHAAMYRTIAGAIVDGRAGDSRHSVDQTAGVTLRLEEQIRDLSPWPRTV